MNEQMVVWLIMVGVFVAASAFRIVERSKEKNVEDYLISEAEGKIVKGYKNDVYDDSDEFGDL